MITNKRNFFLGLFIFIIPFLGLPLWWKFALIVLSALSLMAFSLKFELPKGFPPKSQKNIKKKVKTTTTSFAKVESPNENTDQNQEIVIKE